MEVGDDPSKPQVITPHGKVPLLGDRAIKEEITIEECEDDDIPDEGVKVRCGADEVEFVDEWVDLFSIW